MDYVLTGKGCIWWGENKYWSPRA